MTTVYPGVIDTFTNPLSTSPRNNPSLAQLITNLNDSLHAVEVELGTDPSSDFSSVRARLDSVQTTAEAAIPKSLAIAAHDILVATGAGVWARFPKGSNGYVFRVKSDGSGLEYGLPTALHANLTGLNADDHVQYLNAARHAALDHSSVMIANQSSIIPPGTSWDYYGTSAPTGWFLAQGQAISRTTYSALFAVIGTTHGVGDGSTTFNLPDTRGRFTLGAGQGAGLTNRAVGQKAGEEEHTLTEAEMPSHTHTQDAHNHTASPHSHTAVSTADTVAHNHAIALVTNLEGLWGAPWGGLTSGQGVLNGGNFSADNLHTHPVSTSISSTTVAIGNRVAVNQSTGGDDPHNNMPPFIVCNKIIKF